VGTLLVPALTQLTSLGAPAEPSVWVCPGHVTAVRNRAAREQSPRLCSISVSFQYRFRQYLSRLHIVNDSGSLAFMYGFSQLSTHTINISLKPRNFPQGSAFKTTLLLLKKRGLPLFFL